MSRISDQTSNLILKLLAQFLIFLFIFIYLDYIYLTDIRPDQLAKQNFIQTDCFVMSKKLSSRGRFFRCFRAEFLINYHAKGAQYHRWVSGNGLDMSYSSNNAAQEQLLTDYDDGTNYTCWYDPEHPERAILIPRSQWFSPYTFVLPAIAGLIAAGYFVGNILRLLRMRKIKRHTHKN